MAIIGNIPYFQTHPNDFSSNIDHGQHIGAGLRCRLTSTNFAQGNELRQPRAYYLGLQACGAQIEGFNLWVGQEPSNYQANLWKINQSSLTVWPWIGLLPLLRSQQGPLPPMTCHLKPLFPWQWSRSHHHSHLNPPNPPSHPSHPSYPSHPTHPNLSSRPAVYRPLRRLQWPQSRHRRLRRHRRLWPPLQLRQRHRLKNRWPRRWNERRRNGWVKKHGKNVEYDTIWHVYWKDDLNGCAAFNLWSLSWWIGNSAYINFWDWNIRRKQKTLHPRVKLQRPKKPRLGLSASTSWILEALGFLSPLLQGGVYDSFWILLSFLLFQNLSKNLWELRASQGKSLKARFGSNSRPRVQRRYHRKTSRMRSRWLMASDGKGIHWIHSWRRQKVKIEETLSRNQGCSDWLWYFYLNV